MFRAMGVDSSVLFLSCSITTGASGSPGLLPSCSIITHNHHSHNNPPFYIYNAIGAGGNPFAPGGMHGGSNEHNPFNLMSGFLGAGMGMGMGGGGMDDAIGEILHHILMNEPSHSGAPPATSDTISALEHIEVTEENKEELGECYITQDVFEAGQTAVRLPCKHQFQKEGIVQWLKMHNTCPVCRETVGPDPDKADAESDSFHSSSDEDSEDDDGYDSMPELTEIGRGNR